MGHSPSSIDNRSIELKGSFLELYDQYQKKNRYHMGFTAEDFFINEWYQTATTSKVLEKMLHTNDANDSPTLLPPVFSPSSTADYLYSPLRVSLAKLKRATRPQMGP